MTEHTFEASDDEIRQTHVVYVEMRSGAKYWIGPLTEVAARRQAEKKAQELQVRATDYIKLWTVGQFDRRHHAH
jgi:hypothetical protein